MSRSFMPSGNITPSRFVKIDTSKAGGYVLQAGAGDVVIGIAQPGTRQAPFPGLDDGYAGIADVNIIEVHTEQDHCWVEAGGTITNGDLLKSGSGGVAVTAASDGDYYGARALQSGTSGQLIECIVETGFRGAAA